MGLLSSAIQILHPGGGDLVLYFPPEYLAAIPLALFGFPLALVMAMLIRSQGFKPVSFLLLLGFIPVGLFFYLVTGSSTLTFSQSSRNLEIKNRVFFVTSRNVYPLATVDHAEVQQDDGRSHILYIALTSGERIPTGSGWNPRKGHFQAADAINQYLSQVKGQAGAIHPMPAGVASPSADSEIEAAKKAAMAHAASTRAQIVQAVEQASKPAKQPQ
ncbi:hypothetical protein [Silvibacterium dinghuense]|uniref:Uncharacterized protein n=1 Tax=Silvibacterium dinghuense TaxID=1560006 RepID=A0A4Q1SJH8_9BACT|nr:hypothetical protein [Silvibacterium dinghuense]RXS97430.1 hypothetical protein ESZ00_05910 [Silvibacterium dinghuense]GGG98963.1 hypothetical protein GCM10011586_13050 [Silvibacterium dinghuense]